MNELIKMMQEMPNLLHTITVSISTIQECENKLGLKFSLEYIEYLQKLGKYDAGGDEFTGIYFSKYKNKVIESVVQETLDERAIANEYGYTIPDDFYLIHNLGIGGILIWQNTKGEIYQTIRGLSSAESPKKIYDSMYDYFINEIYRQK